MPDVLLYMQREKGLVSIITPVYKTGALLRETVDSVRAQKYGQFELLLIDDGSGDDTIRQLPDYNDPRIIISTQVNQGMARTRNNGLKTARGEFVLFLDHDDLIEPDFISERLAVLNAQPDKGFAGGIIQTFPDNPKEYMSAAIHIEEEVLFFDERYLTTPSAYLFRRSVLDEHNIEFNENLSSTADRFLLLQLNKVTKGARVTGGKLLYRISSSGFSQIIKPGLIKDNEMMYTEMVKNDLLPVKKRAAFRSLYFFMLAGGYRMVRYRLKAFQYLLKSFFASPSTFFKRITKKKKNAI